MHSVLRVHDSRSTKEWKLEVHHSGHLAHGKGYQLSRTSSFCHVGRPVPCTVPFDPNVRRFGRIPATCFSAASGATVCNRRSRRRLSHSSPAATLAPGGNVVSAGGLYLWALGIEAIAHSAWEPPKQLTSSALIGVSGDTGLTATSLVRVVCECGS